DSGAEAHLLRCLDPRRAGPGLRATRVQGCCPRADAEGDAGDRGDPHRAHQGEAGVTEPNADYQSGENYHRWHPDQEELGVLDLTRDECHRELKLVGTMQYRAPPEEGYAESAYFVEI